MGSRFFWESGRLGRVFLGKEVNCNKERREDIVSSNNIIYNIEFERLVGGGGHGRLKGGRKWREIILSSNNIIHNIGKGDGLEWVGVYTV